MVLYQVNLSIEPAIFTLFKTWLQEHVAEMLEFPGFTEANILTLRDEAETGSINPRKTLIVQYRVQSIEHLNDYLKAHAQMMREKAYNAFGKRFSADRHIYEVAKSVARDTVR